MGSISPECNELKKKYDDCFNAWFARFLEGDQNLSVCDKYMVEYQKCVKVRKHKKVITFFHVYIVYRKTKWIPNPLLACHEENED